ncbi:MAG: acyl-CoA dehydrogenase family protein [Pseudomonadales bacterium]
MRLELTRDEQQFLDDIRGFIRVYWPQPAGAVQAGAQRWTRALVARGWLVPHWPERFGGTGWDLVRQYLWDRETALAGAEVLDPIGVDLAGPLLCAYGTSAQQSDWLPAIRAATARWCLALGEVLGRGPEDGEIVARTVRGGLRLGGVKRLVLQAAASDHMLCLARDGTAAAGSGYALVVVNLHQPGVTIEPVRGLDGRHLADRVTLEGVVLAPQGRIGPARGGLALAATVVEGGRFAFAGAARLEVALRGLRRLAAQVVDGDRALADDADFARKLADLAQGTAAVEALELRVLGALQAGQPVAALRAALRLRTSELGARLADLQVEALGYYALPGPDPVLAHNEGTVGPDYAFAALQGMLAGRFRALVEGSGEEQKSRIAKSVLGF